MIYERKSTGNVRGHARHRAGCNYNVYDENTVYLQYAAVLILIPLIIITAWFCVGGATVSQEAARYVRQIESREVRKHAVHAATMTEAAAEQQTSYEENLTDISSKQRIIEYEILEKQPVYNLNSSDYETLLKIVEAEAGGEDENGKLLVANVVLNRVESDKFPNTVSEVVYQNSNGVWQFSPVKDGRLNSVRVSEETKDAVDRALYGEDISQGALYFIARSAVASDKLQWFDQKLTRLFAYGGHEFFE